MISAWWYTKNGNNFGDIIAPVILEKIAGEAVKFSEEENSLCSIGSIAFFNFPNKMKFWGSGAIDETQRSSNIKKHTYYAVRGPNTRKRILDNGGVCPEVYGDPGSLLPFLFPKQNLDLRNFSEVGIIPHWIDLQQVRNYNLERDKQIKIIDIRQNYIDVITDICSCEMLITSSLHGLITGEAYDIPTVFVEFGKKVVGRTYKFKDYFNSTNRDLVYCENQSEKDIDFKKIEQTLQKMKKGNIDLKKFISSFPYEIKNKNLLEYISK